MVSGRKKGTGNSPVPMRTSRKMSSSEAKENQTRNSRLVVRDSKLQLLALRYRRASSKILPSIYGRARGTRVRLVGCRCSVALEQDWGHCVLGLLHEDHLVFRSQP